MKQLIQNFKTGELYVDEVPVPAITDGFVLVENLYSLISSGTERGTVKVAQASLLGKAKQRPDLVAQVLQNIRKEGLSATIKKVQTKLDSLKALGYSSAGVVLASLDGEGKFKPGDFVACAGQDYASHAEVVAVPRNLVAKIPANVEPEHACFTTLGAIALQGVRQADPKLAETTCVIGLGLLGQITCQLLRSNGCMVLGIDISGNLVEIAKKNSAHHAINRKDPDLERICAAFTEGRGFDNVIITAAAPTNDPLVLAGAISRKKGKVVVVGAVKMEVPRDPDYYRKELDIRMSCSYGPGRYDSEYEEGGHDYPLAYVRWTEQRNMEAFLRLVANGSVNLAPLISHRFPIDDSVKAFDYVLGKSQEPHTGIVLTYSKREGKRDSLFQFKSFARTQEVSVGFIGAGSFAQSYLLPNLKRGVFLHTVSNARGITSKNVASKFGFANASSNSDDIVNSSEINTVFIATPHNSHANLAAVCLRAGKHVFIEKPLAIDYDGLEELTRAQKESKGILMVGFNRRFSKAAIEIKRRVSSMGQPLFMNFRVNAGSISKDHWIQKPEIGGGRIIGEMCHFFDLMEFFCNSAATSVAAESLQAQNELNVNYDNVVITVRFENGSIGNLTYVSIGDSSLPKERLEIFCAGTAFVINDFKTLHIHDGGKEVKIDCAGKGHKEEVSTFLTLIGKGQEPIPFESLVRTTKICLKAHESLATGFRQNI